MKTSPLYLLLLPLLFILSGCVRIATETEYTYNPAIDFKKFQTFDWHRTEVPQPVAGGAGAQFSLLLDQRIKESVASELVKEGLRPDINNPGLLVAYDIAVDNKQLETKDYTFPEGFGYGYSYWYGYRYRYTTDGLPGYQPIQSYAPGTLVIDIIDPTTNQLLWRGYSRASLDPTAADDTRISYVVANIMSQFPPVPSAIR
ncbi:DUF4136 domain-containing protein [Pontibacter akesuensis]|uniref:DUF4136 domain-containing protein n=1 Tax=Pontibacter akesuensis TaxID=388950 RepID=A0A1I7HQB4_9BACT|nr:DUF4136 domain-containing protein [Pontibacter akesuensis]GHA63011.1 hypothetical protein GCM10007389_14280 [Pontibacter akesuensis]SFU62829.1 protein of unknown function [Pontibacter akesuensis]